MSKDKKIVKLAVIRDDDNRACPFGLFIPDACDIAGELVDNMTPIMEVIDTDSDKIKFEYKELKEIVKSNLNVLMFSNGEKKKCKYANTIFHGDKKKVECNYGDEAAGIGNANFIGFPTYTQYFSHGYSSVPIGFYSEHPTRNQVNTFQSMMGGISMAENKNENIKK